MGVILFHRFFPTDLEQVYRTIFLQWREEHLQAFWLSVGGGTAFLCVLLMVIRADAGTVECHAWP
jgi:hypothetical protein